MKHLYDDETARLLNEEEIREEGSENRDETPQGTSEDMLEEIIQRCIEEGVLVDFLLSRKTEVKRTLKRMFDEEDARKVYEEEIRVEAAEKAAETGIRALIATVKNLSQSKDAAIDGLIEQFHLSPQTAAEKVDLYW